MEETDHLYGDLEDTVRQAEIDQLQATVNTLQQENDSMKVEMERMREQIANLVNEKTILETNCVKIFNTATREMQRKEKDIVTLREQLLKFQLADSEAAEKGGMDI